MSGPLSGPSIGGVPLIGSVPLLGNLGLPVTLYLVLFFLVVYLVDRLANRKPPEDA